MRNMIQKKNLILYFDTPKEVSFAYQYIKKSIRKRQEDLLLCFPQEAINIFMARGRQRYISENTFIPQFQKIGKKWVPISPSHIDGDFVLGFPIPAGVTKIFPSIRAISLDKRHIETLFPDITLSSRVCKNFQEVQAQFYSISSELKVLKPASGTRGRGVFIQKELPKQEELPALYYPYLLQEFFDTSSGWGHFVGYHDFRVVILNGDIIGKFLRQPQKGSYISNTHKKGNFLDLWEDSLPEEALSIIEQIDSYLQHNNDVRFYSIDMGKDRNGDIKVFEINSAPGLSTIAIAQALGNFIREKILKIN